MKKIYNYILLTVWALASVCCSEDELVENQPIGKPGEEVQFGLKLNEFSRTIYAPEVYETDSNGNETGESYFPIYWDTDDEVVVASPQCSRTVADYKVTPVSQESYAEAMTRVGEYGVQWGSTETADFYSIYPAANVTWNSLTEDKVVAKLNIASSQSANIVNNSAADMNNVIMYARTPDVVNGKTVILKYTPYSTMLEFELGLAENVDEQGNSSGWGTVKIISLTLTAPTNIAGDFTFDFNDGGTPVITEAGNNSKSITLNLATNPILSKDNQTFKAKLALIPLNVETLSDEWTIAVTVLEGTDTETKTYTKKLNIAKALVPGKVHKVKLPKFSSVTAWTYELSSWITSLQDYKRIYLTELSLPGAWYALGKDDNSYQASDHTAESLWNAGVRAFGVECRSYTANKTLFTSNDNDPSRVVVSGTGSNNNGAYSYETLQNNVIYLSNVISSLASQVANTEEIAVLVLSYADGGSGGHRDKDYAYFINGINTEITNSGATNIVTNVTKDTTVGDVIGQLIIKINVDYNIPIGTYASNMNALFSYNPFLKQLSSDVYTTPLFSNLYWKTWADSYKATTTLNATDFLWCFSSANRTCTDGTTFDDSDLVIPTYGQRQTALRAMISHSKEIWTSGTHNVWFYFNAGGTETTDSEASTTATNAQTFAKSMNAWLKDVLVLKAYGGTDKNGYYTGTATTLVESNPSSLGIVMFNQCTGDNATYYGEDIIKTIVEMNNMYTPAKAPATTALSYDATATSGGNVISLD